MSSPIGYFDDLRRALEQAEVTTGDRRSLPLDEGLALVVDVIASLKGGGKALLIGNGGSAAIVSHMHNDLCNAVAVRAMPFNDLPLLTAVANDDGYQAVFHRPLKLWVEPGDVLIAVSSSGASENIVCAATHAKERGCRLITFTGFKPNNRLRQLGDVNIYVPASHYGYVEMAHSVIAHFLTDTAMARTASPARD